MFTDSWLLSGLSAGAFAAFFTALVEWYRTRPRLNIFQHSLATSWLFPICAEDQEVDKYTAPYRLFVEVGIENTSERPIAIREFEMHFQGHRPILSRSHHTPNPEYKFVKPEHSTGMVQSTKYEKTLIETHGYKFKHTTLPIKDSHLKPIIILQPYTAIEGFLFFPMCPEITED